MKKIRVLGNTQVTVSVVIEVPDNKPVTEEEIYQLATAQFGGVQAFCGNGGVDKLIGVTGATESIDANEPVTFDDFMEE